MFSNNRPRRDIDRLLLNQSQCKSDQYQTQFIEDIKLEANKPSTNQDSSSEINLPPHHQLLSTDCYRKDNHYSHSDSKPYFSKNYNSRIQGVLPEHTLAQAVHTPLFQSCCQTDQIPPIIPDLEYTSNTASGCDFASRFQGFSFQANKPSYLDSYLQYPNRTSGKITTPSSLYSASSDDRLSCKLETQVKECDSNKQI